MIFERWKYSILTTNRNTQGLKSTQIKWKANAIHFTKQQSHTSKVKPMLGKPRVENALNDHVNVYKIMPQIMASDNIINMSCIIA